MPYRLVLLLAVTLLIAVPTHAQIYVDKGAPGANDGTSWTDAYTDLQTAIDNATGSSEIWVAQGVYTPDSEGDSFTITGNIDGVELYGGFEGNESSRSARAPTIHRTILSGDLNGDDTDPDNDGIIEDADPDDNGEPENLSGSNAHHVLVLNGGGDGEFLGIGAGISANVTGATVLDGLYMTAGHASGSGADENGGGLYCDGTGSGNECSPTLRQVVFTGNAAYATDEFSGVFGQGGAIFNNGDDGGTASPSVKNGTFAGNAVGQNGGAIYNNAFSGGSTSSPSITNAVFANNSAGENGGAMYNQTCSCGGSARPVLTNVTFTTNTTSGDGGALYNRGRGNTNDPDGTADPHLTNVILHGNTASGGGDEIYNETSQDGSASPVLSHTIIEGGVNGSGVDGGDSNVDDGGNLDQDPLFVDATIPAGSDGVYATADDGTNIYTISPAVDAGDNGAVNVTEDLTGAPRRQDIDGDGTATVNIGAYEPAQTPPPPTADAVAPSAPYPGHPVQITGANFIGVSEVTYNGTSVAFTAVSETTIRARVPDGTTTDASFEITTPGGTDTSPQVSLDTRPGLYGPRRALAVDGSGDYVATGVSGSALGLVNESFSVGAWFKLRSLTNNRTVVGMDRGASNKALHILVNSDGTLKFGFWSNDLTTASSVIQTGKWYHATIVYDANRSNGQNDRFLYLNGKQVAADESPSDFKGDKELLIGRLDGSRYFDGEIDQVRVWRGTLTQGEVQERAYQTVEPGDAAFSELEAAYRFDAGGTTTAFEQTSSYQFGTFNGDPTRQAVSGARLGQDAVSTTGSDATVGPSGGTLSVTNVSASGSDALQLYQYGRVDGPARTASAKGEDFSQLSEVDRRLNVTWGLSAVGSPTADVIIDYSGLGGLSDPQNVRLLKRNRPGQPWQNVSDSWTWNESAQSFSLDGASSGGEYAIGEASSALPVEMASFDGTTTEDGVQLTWQTASEQNNAGFRVERKGEGREARGEWAEVGFVDGEGTTSEPQRYRFTDDDLPYAADTLRYRLKQVDTDGSATLTDPVTVARGGPDGLELMGTAPNPARQRASVRYGVPESVDGTVQMRLYDVMGRQVQSVQASGEPGRHAQPLDVSGLSSGMYFLRLWADGQSVTRKLTVVQ